MSANRFPVDFSPLAQRRRNAASQRTARLTAAWREADTPPGETPRPLSARESLLLDRIAADLDAATRGRR